MNKLVKIGFSILDYDGPLKEFERTGKGTQFWGQYCSLEADWLVNKIKDKAVLDFLKFPMKMEINLKDEKLSDSLIKLKDLELNAKLNREYAIKSGILKYNDSDISIHFAIKNKRIDIFQVFKNEDELINKTYYEEEYKSYRFYFDLSRNKFFEVDMIKHKISLITLNKERKKEGLQHEFNFFDGSICELNYENDTLQDIQKTLIMSAKLPYTKIWYDDDKFKADKTYFADGSVLRTENDTLKGQLNFPGTNSYLTGSVQNESIEGPCNIILDGKYTIPAEGKNKKMFINDPADFFKSIEDFKYQNIGELDKDKLNGFHEYKYKNGITYTGFFLNDFIYCHKDSLLGSLKGFENKSYPDLEEFFLKIKRFEGILFNGKIQGKAKILYKDGDLYEGTMDDYFNKKGYGTNLQTDGRLYSGDFKRDLYHGLGKLFENKEDFILGFFEEGKLKLKFDLENMDANLYNQIQNQLLKEGDALKVGFLERVMKIDNLPSESQMLELQNGTSQNLAHSFTANLEMEQKKRREEEQKLLNELSKKTAIKTIFHFTNGYVYHGKVSGEFILDGDEGDIIDLEEVRIPVKYKFVNNINLGTFKSKDGNHIFMFKLDVKKLAHIVIGNSDEKKDKEMGGNFANSFNEGSDNNQENNDEKLGSIKEESEDNVFK